jgi:hypothetical protein
MREPPAVPAGYTRFSCAGASVVALTDLAPAVRRAMASGTLYEYAAHHPDARTLMGRGVAYAVPLPDDATTVVIRHSRHGGLLAQLTGDRFLGRTRAPAELDTALRLAGAGVPTPQIVAYALYPAGPAFQRADVATREVAHSRDLARALAENPDPACKRELLSATATLLARLTAAGARHPDLNLKNVLLARDARGEISALVLDVDRVRFVTPGAPGVTAANLRRFNRSARKLRRTRGTPIDETDLLSIAAMIHELPPSRA